MLPAKIRTSRISRTLLIGAAAAAVAVYILTILWLAHAKATPHHRGTVYLTSIPEVGTVWVEGHDTLEEPPLEFRPIRPEWSITRNDGSRRPTWSIACSHTHTPDVPWGTLTWDGGAIQFGRGDGSTNAQAIALRPAAEWVSSEARAGVRVMLLGISGRWRSTRPRWPDPGPLDLMLETNSLRMELACLRHFVERVHTSFDWLDWRDLMDSPDHGAWSCSHWQVVYHRSRSAVSVLNCTASYLGGMHGNYGEIADNFIRTPKGFVELGFTNLFRPDTGWQQGILRLVMDDLRRQGASFVVPPEDQPGEKPTVDLKAEDLEALTFTGTSTGIQVHFDPYAVGSYAEGVYVVELTWRDLGPWISAEVFEAFNETPSIPSPAAEVSP